MEQRRARHAALAALLAVGPAAHAQTTTPAAAVAFRDPGQLVVAAYGGIDVWDLSAARVLRTIDIDRAHASIERVLDPRGRWLALHRYLELPFVSPPADAASRLHDTRAIDVDTGETITLHPPVTGRPAGLAFARDTGVLIRLTLQDARLAYDVWRLPAEDRIASGHVPMAAGSPASVAVSPTADRFAIVWRAPDAAPDAPAQLLVYDAGSGRVLQTTTAGTGSVVVTPAGDPLMVPRGAVPIFDPRSGEVVRMLPLTVPAGAVAVSADGRLVATATRGQVQVFGLASPTAPAVFSTSLSRRPGTPVPPGRFGAGAYYPGGDIAPPEVVRQAQPRYTAAAMREKINGIVVVEMVVGADGSPGEVRVLRSLDPQHGLDDAAVAAAREWRFQPARDANGLPVPVLVRLELEFRVR